MTLVRATVAVSNPALSTPGKSYEPGSENLHIAERQSCGQKVALDRFRGGLDQSSSQRMASCCTGNCGSCVSPPTIMKSMAAGLGGACDRAGARIRRGRWNVPRVKDVRAQSSAEQM